VPLNLEFEFWYLDEPEIRLRLRAPDTGQEILTSAILDTGADISLFDDALAKQLGIDLTGARPIAFRGLNGQAMEARQAHVDVLLLEEPALSASVTIAFSPRQSLILGNLIGLDVLEHFDFGLSHRDRLGYLGRPVEST
jgi:hypothetical protein